jgi:predicted nuclease of predicted toxin-antitoxin system
VRLLLDENVSPIIGVALADAGHDVSAAVAVCPGALDTDLVAIASTEARIIVSEDKDFGELVFRDGLRPPGLIRLMLPGYWPAEKATRLLEVLTAAGTSAVGAILVIEPTRTRLRQLP